MISFKMRERNNCYTIMNTFMYKLLERYQFSAETFDGCALKCEVALIPKSK